MGDVFELGWNVIYDFPEVQQICRWLWSRCVAVVTTLKAARLAAAYLTSPLTAETSPVLDIPVSGVEAV